MVKVIMFALGLVIALIIIFFIILPHIKRNKRESELMPKLDAWVKNAKELGYNYTKIRTILIIHDWDKGLIKKALKKNRLEKPVYYR